MTTTIGQLANVPTPGDPIASDWAQDVTPLGRHVFASKAALDAATWPGLANGMFAYTTSEQLMWERVSGAWRAAGFARLLGRKIDSTNVSVPTGGADIVAALSVTLPAARLIRIRGQANFTAAASIGAYINAVVDGSIITPRLAQWNNLNTGALLTGQVLTLASSGTRAIKLTATGIAGTASTAGATDPSVLEVWDEGPGPLPS